MKAKRVPDKNALGRCSWCGKRINANMPVYGFGGRKRPGVDLSEYEGSAILIPLVTVPKEVIGMVTAPDSPAKADGKDFMFMICSEVCADEMKSVMDAETALGNALFGNLEEMENRGFQQVARARSPVRRKKGCARSCGLQAPAVQCFVRGGP